MIFNNAYSGNSASEQPFLHSLESYYHSPSYLSDYSRQTIDNYILPFDSYMQKHYMLSPNGNDDVLANFLNAKTESLVEMAKGIFIQISERIDLKYENLYELDQRICGAGSIICQLDHFDLGVNGAVDKRRANVEKDLISFEREQRFEKVACWRDVSRLKGQLLEIKQQLDNRTSKQKLING